MPIIIPSDLPNGNTHGVPSLDVQTSKTFLTAMLIFSIALITIAGYWLAKKSGMKVPAIA